MEGSERKISSGKIAVVTGGNRGIGFFICRGLAKKGIRVVLTSRDKKNGEEALAKLHKESLDVHLLCLDMTDERSIHNFAENLEKEFEGLDILINNAAVSLDKGVRGLDADVETIRRSMEANVYGPLRLCQALIPIMRKRGEGRIVNVSSQLGAVGQIRGDYPGYRISKAALNVLTLMLADEVREANILVNAMTPGWARTEMGGQSAPRSPKEGADTAIWLAVHPKQSLTSRFFMDRKVISW